MRRQISIKTRFGWISVFEEKDRVVEVKFGKHTTAFKVSIERENFKAIQVTDLNKLSAAKVFEKIEEKIN